MPVSPVRLGALTAALCAGVPALMLSTTTGAAGGADDADGSPALVDPPWDRHAIVAGTPGSTNFDGSDGVDLVDLNGDGGLDVVSGYEQGHQVSLSLHPDGAFPVENEWSSRTVKLASPKVSDGALNGPEDATFGDVDGDGRLDIVVSAEADQQVTVLFAPASNADLLDASKWVRTDIAASEGLVAMRAEVIDMNGGAPDLLVGSKESSSDIASLGYYTSSDPRSESSWEYHEILRTGWTMQMLPVNVDGDADMDVVYSDRDPIDEPDLPLPDRSNMGVRWLENPGDGTTNFEEHTITPPTAGGEGERYHKWFSLTDWDGDSDIDVVDCRSDVGSTPEELSIWRNSGDWITWTEMSVPYPAGVGMCVHVTVADIDGDGHEDDLGVTFALAGDGNPSTPDSLSGLVWLENSGTPTSPIWTTHEIGGTAEGIKYDNLVWADLDGDTDLDAVTSEQHEDTALPVGLRPGLGVIWYENPRLQPRAN